ncbi:MAG: hypothetical protein RR965_08015, partial [Enterococcus sp.]
MSRKAVFRLPNPVYIDLDNQIKISAKTGYGIEELKNKIKELFFSGDINSESLIVSNVRHKQAL